MANLYAVRIHELAADFRDRVSRFCESVDGSYVVAREVEAKRHHYQGWVRTSIQPQAFRVRVKKAFPECVGNRAYSVKAVRNFESYSRYILKGTRETLADVVCYQGLEITPEFLADEHREYWSRAESNRSFVEEVHEWVVERRQTHVVDRRAIAERVCDLLTSRKKALNIFYVRSVVNAVAYLTDLNGREIILDEVQNKY